MIKRNYYLNQIQEGFEMHSVCAILGPRQCGKTTLAKQYSANLDQVHFFDLENPQDLSALESPSLILPKFKGLVVLDEIQRRPDLFPYLRYLTDNSDLKFLVLGSASQDLINQTSETLAGRISYLELPPFQFNEFEKDSNENNNIWIRGGFPKSLLAKNINLSEKWRFNYIKTFLERDLSMMGIQIVPNNMRRLWNMIAHYHGQIANIAELSRSLDMTNKTIKRYLDILEGCFMIRQLKPWHENLAKRQVKRAKIYIRDSGILHSLLNISDDNLYKHPKLGASWEGFALESIIQANEQSLSEFYFWGTEAGAELDLLIIKGSKRIGFEFKHSDQPKVTKSMHIAIEDLKLDELNIITPGKNSYQIAEKIFVKNLSDTF